MRFDFTHFERLKPEELAKIEEMVNEKILENRKTEWKILPIEEAKSQGAMALFGEKYGDTVRMVEIKDYSRELCGGTHVRATGEIGEFVIVNETSVAAGIRRIECLTGMKAHAYLRSRNRLLEQAAALLNCPPDETGDRISALMQDRKQLEQQLAKLRQASSKDAVSDLLDNIKETNSIRYVTAEVQAGHVDDLRQQGDLVRDGLGSGVAVLGAVINDKVSIACIVTKDLIQTKGLKAGDIVKKVASFAGGGGGGSPHMALAGAKDVDKLSLALSKVEDVINELLN
jgi:alanyl-tRNA synthetase